jgi:hypothetical protein
MIQVIQLIKSLQPKVLLALWIIRFLQLYDHSFWLSIFALLPLRTSRFEQIRMPAKRIQPLNNDVGTPAPMATLSRPTPHLFLSGFDKSYNGVTRAFVLKQHVARRRQNKDQPPSAALNTSVQCFCRGEPDPVGKICLHCKPIGCVLSRPFQDPLVNFVRVSLLFSSELDK